MNQLEKVFLRLQIFILLVKIGRKQRKSCKVSLNVHFFFDLFLKLFHSRGLILGVAFQIIEGWVYPTLDKEDLSAKGILSMSTVQNLSELDIGQFFLIPTNESSRT